MKNAWLSTRHALVQEGVMACATEEGRPDDCSDLFYSKIVPTVPHPHLFLVPLRITATLLLSSVKAELIAPLAVITDTETEMHLKGFRFRELVLACL